MSTKSSRTGNELEFYWKPTGIIDFLPLSLYCTHLNSTTEMQTKDFSIFKALLSEVHQKAFGEPIAKIRHGKANTLAWIIEEETGVMLSYKSLTNYVNAVLEGQAEKVNPNCATLAALTQFATGEKPEKQLAAIWFKYRAGMLAAAA